MAYAETVAKSAVDATLHGWRYVITPYYYTALLLYRLVVPEILDTMFYYQTVTKPKYPANKQIVDVTGAQKYLYAESTQKAE